MPRRWRRSAHSWATAFRSGWLSRAARAWRRFLGILLALAPSVGLAAIATWLVVAAIFRFSSLAALAAAGFAPVWGVFLGHGQLFVLGIVLAILIYLRHWQNIARLRAGTETRIGQKG